MWLVSLVFAYWSILWICVAGGLTLAGLESYVDKERRVWRGFSWPSARLRRYRNEVWGIRSDFAFWDLWFCASGQQHRPRRSWRHGRRRWHISSTALRGRASPPSLEVDRRAPAEELSVPWPDHVLAPDCRFRPGKHRWRHSRKRRRNIRSASIVLFPQFPIHIIFRLKWIHSFFLYFFSLYIVFKLGSKIVGERDRWHIWKCNTWDSVGILAGLSEVFDGRGIMGGRSISQDQFRGKEERILVRRSRRSTCDYSYDLRRWLVRVALWVYIRAEIGGVNADSSQTSDGFSRMVWFSVCSLSLSLSDVFLTSEAARLEGGGFEDFHCNSERSRKGLSVGFIPNMKGTGGRRERERSFIYSFKLWCILWGLSPTLWRLYKCSRRLLGVLNSIELIYILIGVARVAHTATVADQYNVTNSLIPSSLSSSVMIFLSLYNCLDC